LKYFAVRPELQVIPQALPAFHLPLFQRPEQIHGDSFFST